MIKLCVLYVYDTKARDGGLCLPINESTCYIHRITDYISHLESTLSRRALTVVHIDQTRPTIYSELKTSFTGVLKSSSSQITSDNAQIIGILKTVNLSPHRFIMRKSRWFQAYFLFMIFS